MSKDSLPLVFLGSDPCEASLRDATPGSDPMTSTPLKRKKRRVLISVQSKGWNRESEASICARIISSAIISNSRVEHICHPRGTFRSM